MDNPFDELPSAGPSNFGRAAASVGLGGQAVDPVSAMLGEAPTTKVRKSKVAQTIAAAEGLDADDPFAELPTVAPVDRRAIAGDIMREDAGEQDRTGMEILGDLATAVRTGRNTVASATVGLPVNAANFVINNPMQRLAQKIGDALGFDVKNASEVFGGPEYIPQPEAVRGTQDMLARYTVEDENENLSQKTFDQRAILNDKDGMLDSLEYLVTHPTALADQGAQQVGQVLNVIPGAGVGANVAAGAASAAGQAAQQTEQALRDQGVTDEAQIAKAASDAFAQSLVLNAGVNALPGGTAIERAVGGRGTGASTALLPSIVKSGLGEGIGGVISEGGDQIIQNRETGRPWDEGLGQATALGAIFDGVVGSLAGASEAMKERGEAPPPAPQPEPQPQPNLAPNALSDAIANIVDEMAGAGVQREPQQPAAQTRESAYRGQAENQERPGQEGRQEPVAGQGAGGNGQTQEEVARQERVARYLDQVNDSKRREDAFSNKPSGATPVGDTASASPLAAAAEAGSTPQEPASPLDPRLPPQEQLPDGYTEEDARRAVAEARTPDERARAAGRLAAVRERAAGADGTRVAPDAKAGVRSAGTTGAGAGAGNQRTRTGDTDVEVRAALGEAAKGVTIVSSASDLPADVAKRTGINSDSNADVEGFYDPETGQSYVIEDALDTESGMTPGERKVWVAAHERSGHAGLRGMLQAEGTPLASTLGRARQNETVSAIADAMGKQRPEGAERLVEEAIAELAAAVRTGNYAEIESRYGIKVPEAQRKTVAGYIHRLVQQIRSALKFGPSVSDAEIYKLIEGAHRYASENGATPTRKSKSTVAQRAFHGTANKGIERFTLDKVGTGSGDQNYGWGIYTAQQEKTADTYRRALSSVSKANGGILADALMRKNGSDRMRTIEDIRRLRSAGVDAAERATGMTFGSTGSLTRQLDGAEKFIRANMNRGQLYGVEVPEDSELLNWDAPLSEQPSAVRAALKNVKGGDLFQESMQPFEDTTGFGLYRALEADLGSDKAASQALGEVGIPGLRYKDGATRYKADSTYNYVVWDESRMGDPEGLIASRTSSGLLRNLTKAEQAKVTEKVAEKVVKILSTLPPKKEMAAVAYAGKAKRGWYADSTKAIADIFGADAPKFAGLLAALSPQISVEGNLKNALNVWAGWEAAGRPSDPEAILLSLRGTLRRTFGNSLPAWENNSVRALTDAPLLSGPKVNSFMQNLLGNVEEVTNDAWMANFAKVDQTLFKGGLLKSGKDPGKGAGYLAMNARVRETARELTKLTGETWTPAEVQETVWSWAKTITELADSAAEVRNAKELVADQALTDELIASTPDFGTLLTDPTYASILEEAGYGEQIDRIRSSRRDAEATGEKPKARSQAAPFDSDTQRRLEARSAARIDQLRKERLAAEGSKDLSEPEEDIPFSRKRTVNPYGEDAGADLQGMPTKVRVGDRVVEFHGYQPAQQIAAKYAKRHGNSLPTTYAAVDEKRAERIAAAYEKMKHDPQNPEVKKAYAAMIDETLQQYRDILKTGLEIEFIQGEDPYASSPREAILDVVENNHLWVFPTDGGFGSSELDVSDNPLLAETEFKISGKTALANDIFRVVHDYFGHIANGVGFRADGEENAWREHSAMYSPLARRAMTGETRGQNSWVNYGPNGEANRTSSGADTVYADQKTGLLPQWVSEDGRTDEQLKTETSAFKKWFGDSKVVDEDGNPKTVYHGGKVFDSFRKDPSALAHYATDSLDVASGYADQYSNDTEIKSLYLSINNPLDLRDPELFEEWTGSSASTANDMARNSRPIRSGGDVLVRAKDAGYDGVIFYDTDVYNRGAETAYAFFAPNQAKAAEPNDWDIKPGSKTWWDQPVRRGGNSGAFSQEDDSIIASRGFSAKPRQPDAVSVDAYHYSREAGLDALDPAQAGSGSAGAERRRLGTGTFGRNGGTSARVGFYVREPGAPIPPAEAVVSGRNLYRVKLDNLYDLDADPKDLVGRNQDETEEAISDAGYDGFVTSAQAGIDVPTAVVFDIPGKIPVEAVEEGVVASRGRKRDFDSKAFGKEIIPAARRASQELGPLASSAIQGFQMGVLSKGNRIETDESIADDMEEAFAPVREKLRALYGDTVRLYRSQDRNPKGERKLLSWSFSAAGGRVGAGAFLRDRVSAPSAAEIDAKVKQLRERGHVTVNGERYVRSKQWPEAPGEYFMIYDKYGNVVTDMVGVESLRDRMQWDVDFAAEENSIRRNRDAMYVADVPVEQIKWIMPNAISTEAIVERDPAAEGDEIIASRRTPAQANAQRNQLLGQMAANGYAQGQPIPLVHGGKMQTVKAAADAVRIKLQDKMLPLLRAQDRAGYESAPGVTSFTLDDAMNAYRAENLMHGRAKDQLETANMKYILPAQEQMRRLGISADILQDVMIATHAPERNAKVASLKGGMQDGAAGITTQEAADILAGNMAGPYSGKKLTPKQISDAILVWDKFRAIRDLTIQNMVDSGQIDQAQATTLSTTYPNYVPLRGVGQKNDEFDQKITGTGRGLTVVKSRIKRALGRGKGNLPEDILGEIVGDLQCSISVKEKAVAARALVKFALAHPMDDLFKVEPVDLEWKYSESTGEVYLGVRNSAEDVDRSIVIRHNGKPVRLRFENEQLRDAVMNMGVADVGDIVHYLGAINRIRSALLTRFNPAFIPINVLRDLQFGMTALAAERGPVFAAKALANYVPAMYAMGRDSTRFRRGDSSVPDSQKTNEDWAREASENGMKTGLTQVDEAVDLQKRLSIASSTVMQLAAQGKPIRAASEAALRAAIRPLAETIETINDATENALRLATYIQDRKAGKSPQQAAEYAKNLTINFNRKGQYGPFLNSIYMFFNASMQGTHAVARVMRNPKVVAGLVGLAGLQAYLIEHLMDDDDDGDGVTTWDSIPDYVKRTSFIIPLGAITGNSGDYFALPMPYGFNVFPYAGARITQMAKQGERPTDSSISADLFKSITEAFSPVPVDEHYGSLFGDQVAFMMQLAGNKDDRGYRIANEDQYADYEGPKALTGSVDTPRAYQAGAQLLAKIGGGDLEERIPPVGYLDVSPEQLEYMTQFMGGGVASLLNKGTRWWEQADAKNFDTGMQSVSALPIASRLFGTANDARAVAERYYGERGEFSRNKDIIGDRIKAGEDPEAVLADRKNEYTRGLGPEKYKKSGKRPDGSRYKKGEGKRTETGNAELSAADNSPAKLMKDAEKAVKSINKAIKQIRAGELTNEEVAKIVLDYRERGESEFGERRKYTTTDLGLPDGYDGAAKAPKRVQTRAIKLLQDSRVDIEQSPLRGLELERKHPVE